MVQADSKKGANVHVPPPAVISRIIDGLNRDLRSGLEVAKAVSHHGEAGRAREEVVCRYLRMLVPADFGIDTGFVIDSSGSVSRQVDIVIYRTSYHPVFDIGGVKFFPVESVLAAIENKTTLDSRAKVEDAIAAVTSVKVLDRTGGGRNYSLGPAPLSFLAPLNPDIFDSQVFTAVLTETAVSRELFLEALQVHLGSHPRREWLNLFVDISEFGMLYQHEEEDGTKSVRANPMTAKRVVLTSPGPYGNEPLHEFATELLNFLRVAQLIDYHATSYLPNFSYHNEALDLDGFAEPVPPTFKDWPDWVKGLAELLSS